MLANRVRMSMRREKNSEVGEIEVTIHISGFRLLKIYVGDGTLNQYGDPDYASEDTLVYTANGDETVTLIVEEGSYITVTGRSIYAIDWSFYYTSLDSTVRGLHGLPPQGGNIHITEPMDIYYISVED